MTDQNILEEFRGKFLKDLDGNLGPNLNVPHGTLAYIADLEDWLTTKLSDVRKEEREIVLDELETWGFARLRTFAKSELATKIEQMRRTNHLKD